METKDGTVCVAGWGSSSSTPKDERVVAKEVPRRKLLHLQYGLQRGPTGSMRCTNEFIGARSTALAGDLELISKS
jgi:hypothetical protein